MSSSRLEAVFLLRLKALGLPDPEREYKFHPERRWKFDFAWPERKIAIEVEGGIWSRGRHTRGNGYINDCEKYNSAVLLGWRVLRYPQALFRNVEDDMKTLAET